MVLKVWSPGQQYQNYPGICEKYKTYGIRHSGAEQSVFSQAFQECMLKLKKHCLSIHGVQEWGRTGDKTTEISASAS